MKKSVPCVLFVILIYYLDLNFYFLKIVDNVFPMPGIIRALHGENRWLIIDLND